MERTLNFHSHQKVVPLGYGAGHIGQDHLDEDFVGSLLNEIINLGINFIDTARGYGQSEDRIGRHLSWRRKDFVLSTKVGYMVQGFDDWTYDGIVAGVEQALGRMNTHYIDVCFLHSCSLDILQKGEVLDALQRCKEEGMILATGYSGENQELEFALKDPRVDALQCSVNLSDQKSIREIFPKVHGKKGLVAKRPLANAPWRFENEPHGLYCHAYWKRLKELALDELKPQGMSWTEFALRFTLSSAEVTSAIVGSLNLENVRYNWESFKKGPLPGSLFQKIRARLISMASNGLEKSRNRRKAW